MRHLNRIILLLVILTANNQLAVSKDEKALQCVRPTGFTVFGGGTICAGSAGVTITLTGSQVGVRYQLRNGGTNQGSPLAGTGLALNFTNQTVAGNYTVLATNTTTGCTRTMFSSATINVNPLPTAFNIGGGGAICSGAPGVSITLSGSQNGVRYQLMNGSAPGPVQLGTGAALSYTNLTTAGTYTIIATNNSTTCSTQMNGTAVIVVNPLPVVFNVGGGGATCASSNAAITLSGSESGVNYQLRIGGTNQGAPVAGTGSVLNLSAPAVAGNYTVFATNASTGCARAMSGSATVTLIPAPTAFNVTGGGTICSGAAGVTITLSGSQTGVTYQLKNGTTNQGSPVNGTGGVLNITNQTVAGNYTIVATRTLTGCSQTMNGSATVTVNPLPTLFIVGGGGAICSGSITSITLSGSQTGVNYQLVLGTTNQGAPMAGNGSALSFSNQTSAGTYTVVATNASTGCKLTMTGNSVISINPLPNAFTVGGGGAICTPGVGIAITLSGSQTGVNYQLMMGTASVGSAVPGNGTTISFPNQNAIGTYTVVATTTATTCQRTMTGSANVTSNLPAAFTVTGGGAICSDASTTITLSGSQTGVNYQLVLGTTNQGTPIAGTGLALTFGNETVAGTYTVVATNATTGCTQTMTGSATITTNAQPTVFTVSGGGAICSDASTTITLSGSQTGVNYQLVLGTTNQGTPIAGTGLALTFGNETVAGTYTVVATNATTGCTQTMTGSATITTNAQPTVFTVSGGGAICSDASTTITLSGSQTGVNYQLVLGTTNQGTPIAGTGLALTFGNETVAGTYTVVATNATTGCTQAMTGSAIITTNAQPTVFTVSGGGAICSDASTTITLSGSQTGVNYQLVLGTTNQGTPIAGTGLALTFGNETVAGTYTVVATNATTGCTQTMTGSATITTNAQPTVFTVSGGGAICSDASTTITLSGSQTGVNYQLVLGTTNQGTPIAGTGLALTFGNETVAGTYTVVATNATTGCTQTMTGSATITTNAQPTVFTVSGGGAICSDASTTITLSGSQTGVNYQLVLGTTNQGTPVAGTGLALTFGNETVAGTYTVVATNATTGCTQAMTGSATITTNAQPTVYTVNGGGAICSGANTTITLTGSETGVNYQLVLGTTNQGTPVAGTGSALTFTNEIVAGTYTVVATNATTGCTQTMTGSATITTNAQPTVFTVSGGGTICSGANTVITLSGSETGVNYQLVLGTTNQGTPIAGTGSALTFTNEIVAGTYTVVATNATTGCTQAMTGSAIITTNAQPTVFTVSGGGAICSGANTTITLSGSQTGVNYQLVLGTTNQGTPVAGSGSALTFSNETSAGTYTVVATNATTNCTQAMTGSATITTNAQPIVFTISGGGAICSGASTTITLSGSETGVNYQLVLGTTNQGTPVAGSGSALTFSNETSAGTYTVVATNATTNCTQAMTGSATITTNAQPTVYTVSGGGAICSGANTTITLSGSQTGVNYQLVLGSTNQGTPIAGTGSALIFANETVAGTYTVVATNATTSCTQAMTGSANITINVQTVFNVGGGGNYCTGGEGLPITLSGSETGVNYQLQRGNSNIGSPLPGTGSSLTWLNNLIAGTYTILATNLSENCTQVMSDSSVIAVHPIPTKYGLVGGNQSPVILQGSQVGVKYQLQLKGNNIGTAISGTGKTIQWPAQTTPGTYTVKATNDSTGCSDYMSNTTNVTNQKIPEAVKVTRQGVLPTPPKEQQFTLSVLHQGDAKEIFPAPPCLDGNYYVGFQLYYDLGDKQTKTNWVSQLTLTILHGEDSLTSLPLQVNMKDQLFISTEFYDSLLSCSVDYRFMVNQKVNVGSVPEGNVYLKVLLYKSTTTSAQGSSLNTLTSISTDTFDPLSVDSLNCDYTGTETNLSWKSVGSDAIEYDIEWVFIDSLDVFTGSTAQDAFQFKEPVRITTAGLHYSHLIFYPRGKIWYRARAIGYNPQYPDHRIQGEWFYSPCQSIEVFNPQRDKNWQQQTVFAEEGKYKKVLHYFDGSMRERQSQTNLSTEGVTLVGESLYDFEGRKSVDILPVPATDATLTFKAGFNIFQAHDGTVSSNTSATRIKFNYDNYRLENSILSSSSGTGQYYSSASVSNSVHKDYIPDAQGYAYSQTEYTNDGTGRIKRQAGVGQTFRTDGDHTTRHFYGAAAPTELIRLFGSNVGVASHYKKNMVVDANGQTSVTYLDQEGRTIATALAGDNPSNVDALDSYKKLDPTPITVDVSPKNTFINGSWVVTHSILNAVPNTPFSFKYKMAALASQVDTLGCKACVYDLMFTLTDPDGTPLDLSSIPGNQSPDSVSYLRTGLTAASCTDSLTVKDVQIDVLLAQAGDYTITKTLTPRELSFDVMKDIVSKDSSTQKQIQQIEAGYTADPNDCAICNETCPDAEQAIQDAIKETTTQDCINIYNQIIADLKSHHEDDPDYEPTPKEIHDHPSRCQYDLCLRNSESESFEKQLSRYANWSAWLSFTSRNPSLGDSPLSYDPFFNIDSLSGFNFKSQMQGSLNDVHVADVSYDNNNDGVPDGSRLFHGPIDQVTNPDNTSFYVDVNGNPDPVNGKHLLYTDLMNKRSQLGENAYLSQLDAQRWQYFRGYYDEAKRQVKLTIPAYQNCDSALQALKATDNLPTTPDAIAAYGEANGITAKPDSVAVASSLYSIKTACDTTFSKADSAAIYRHLNYYFVDHQSNFFRLIIDTDVKGVKADSSLVQVQTILQKYGCSLDSVAVVDPIINCVSSTSITTDKKLFAKTPHALQVQAMAMTTLSDSSSGLTSQQSSPMMMAMKTSSMNGVQSPDTTTNKLVAKRDKEMSGRMKKFKDSIIHKRRNHSDSIWRKKFKDKLDSSMAHHANRDSVNKINHSKHAQRIGRHDKKDSTKVGQNKIERLTSDQKLPEERKKFIKKRNEQLIAHKEKIKKGISSQDKTANTTQSVSSMALMSTLSSSLALTTAEYSALLDLYNSTNGAHWTNKTGWSTASSTPQDVSGWYGVTTDANGHVIGLNLQGNYLYGTLPSSIGNLTYLLHLKLGPSTSGFNFISGTIPSSLWNLNQLITLDLMGNVFTGSIPSSIGNLQNLQYLMIGWVNDYGLSGTIPTEIGTLLQLKKIDLSTNNSLTGPIPDLSALSNLTYLDLGGNLLEGPFPSLPSSLTYLSLAYNNLDGQIPASIDQLTQLAGLQIYHNNFSGTIPQELGSLSNLLSLDLSSNQLSGNIPDSFGNLSTHTSIIRIDNNLLSGPLPASFGSPDRQTYQMSIENNMFTFSDFLYVYTNGDGWAFSYQCGFSDGAGPCFTYSPQAIIDTEKTLSGIEGQPFILSTSIDRSTDPASNYQWFKYVDGYNDIALKDFPTTFNYADTIPSLSLADDGLQYYYTITNDNASDLTLTSNLQTLNVAPSSGCSLQTEYNALMALYNATNGPAWRVNDGWGTPFPTDVGQWTGVTTDAQGHVISLQIGFNNNLQGAIPSEISNLCFLQTLGLNNNQLTGPIPESISTISSLQSLGLSNNHLTGPIPESISTISSLQFLDLDGNELTGEIPESIGNLNNLLYLDLSGNQLTGSIPSSITTISTLQNLNFDLNQLTGTIPENIGDLASLRELALGGNHLTGTIPSSIGAMLSLQYVTLNSNYLTGTIPDAIGNLTGLVTIDFSNNQLTGSIPSLLSTASIDLSSNQLSGEVPALSSSALFLSNNLLTSISPDIDLENLGSVFIDNNLLRGPIPRLFRADFRSGAFEGSIANNFLTFSDIISELASYPNDEGSFPIEYAPQGLVDSVKTIPLSTSPITLTAAVDRSVVPGCQYQWFKYVDGTNDVEVTPRSTDSFSYTIPQPSVSDTGRYYYTIINTNTFGAGWNFAYLKLQSNLQTIKGVLRADTTFTVCQQLDTTNTTAQQFNYTVDWNQQIQQCMKRAAQADSALTQYAIDKLIDIQVTNLYNKYNTLCAQNVTEKLTYTYVSKEYHYTLYYYDQAGNLVQTVPPKGVVPLTDQQVASSLAGPKTYLLNQYYSKNGSKLSSVTDTLGVTREMVVVDTTRSTQGVLLEDTARSVLPGEKYILKVKGYATRDTVGAIPYLYVASGNKILAWQNVQLPFDAVNENWVSQEFIIPDSVTSIKYGVLWKFDSTVYADTLFIRQAKLIHEGNVILPEHTLVTRYQYNSINQLVGQQTPDAGNSDFFYNNKGQLKLSQNAQQAIDLKYSYTKYDEQGRIAEVGEINSQIFNAAALSDSINSPQFPMASLYSLKDVTLTHYDEADIRIQKLFTQENLRSRLSFVEVTDATRPDTVRTFYSYDIHGNVKSLQQNLPGLAPKRTDYVYDLESGKVNYVFYQFGKPDQFVHRYQYDADNRITDVLTSTDRFIWNKEANYSYYFHGPLARTELGQYRVQGMDYYYTLQGWIKGVNMPYAGDPGADGLSSGASAQAGKPTSTNAMVGKDIFAYSLGYFQNDYAPITAAMTTVDSRDQLWTRSLENINHTGLYNGNISWMETDLSALPSAKTDRTKGMQAMMYRYDQLHRIVKSRSLTSYSASGFAVRPATAAYDEDYSYDPNGNILALNRNDEAATLKDDFDYRYYDKTNRLQQHKTGGGLYQYDAIGNLINDGNEGTIISWTPYGKVRTVMKGDSITVSYRYDAAGNRVEKKVVKSSSIKVTNYLRNASGKVMIIYKDTVAAEIPIYGSSRLGEYKGGVVEGERTLGKRNFELGNHLGNVLTVITDNVGMQQDSVWATVISVSDYYPFGLEMKGRSWSDTTSTYRYGFNGKEKDNSFASTTDYDYGFRIYSPEIGKFLSIDPLATKYPYYTPYQFAGNKPIYALDLDGLEEVPANEIWTWDSYGSTENGIVSESFYPVRNQEGQFYLHEIQNGRNKGNFLAKRIYGRTDEGILVYENAYIVGKDAFTEFESEEYEGGGMGYGYRVHAAGILMGGDRYGTLEDLDYASFLKDQWTDPEKLIMAASLYVSITPRSLKGMNNAKVKSAVNLGNKVHYDQLNGGAGVGLPVELSKRYPKTVFKFAKRGQSGADVEVVGGTHPSKYPNSNWDPASNYADFKPNTVSGNRTFNAQVKSGKLPKGTQKLTYDSKTGKLN